jgi:RNA-directed DNA polymerase
LDAVPAESIEATPVAAVAAGMANGPEDRTLDWPSIDWRQAEDQVRRLRQRIFTATQEGDLKRVRNLQKLMLRSRANALLSVRRVTEINAGRNTAGVDGRVVLLAPQKAELADWVQHQDTPWTVRPVKRVFIPKANGKQRPLGIPVIVDRALQAWTLNALEPEWEARFEPRSYGFRPGRGCHDAVEAIFNTAKGLDPKRRWVLDADLAAAFDRIDHHHLLDQLGAFPARVLIAGWLKSGVLDRGRFAPTEEGTPQGGVISPLLLNVALHGMEQAAGVRRRTGVDAGKTARDSPVLVRYADDLVVFCHTRDRAEQVKAQLAAWLAPRGLAFNDDKTRVVNLDEGFDFLGFNVRRYRDKLLIKPSKTAVKRIRARLRTELRALRGANAQAVLARLNPIIRGWAAYYRIAVSSRTFHALDAYLWKLTYKWARHSHPNKPRRWVTTRYYGRFNTARQDRWVFGDRESGAYLLKFSWTGIARHQMVTGAASVDDPALADYWTQRRSKKKPPLDSTGRRLLAAQHGRCPICGGLLLHAEQEPQSPDDWAQWISATHKAIRKNAIIVERAGTSSDETVTLLLHAHCRPDRLTRQSSPAPTCQPPGLA